jgi:BirA family transcriptional regulator, biotin operon repressor / biotin---[acetyl-CoA-carboxylase] ligase
VFLSEMQKKILQLLADGQFHSGSSLSVELGVSRTAIWKQLSSFNEVGLELISVKGKGYRLSRPLELLDAKAILAKLSGEVSSLVSTLTVHDQLASTNTYLIEQAKLDSPSGSVCLAEYQSAGRGRRGRNWVSPFGSNIYLSVLWRFQEGPSAISGLSLAVGIAIVRALKAANINGIGLKWPNDIYWQGHKLGGILVEVSGESNGPISVVTGIGLNLYIPQQQAQRIDQVWTDLEKVSQTPVSRNQLTSLLLEHLLPVLNQFSVNGIQDYLDEWRSYDCLKDQCVTVFIGNEALTGVAEGIDDDGLFRLRGEGGKIKSFASGEISFSSKR